MDEDFDDTQHKRVLKYVAGVTRAAVGDNGRKPVSSNANDEDTMVSDDTCGALLFCISTKRASIIANRGTFTKELARVSFAHSLVVQC